MDGKIILPEKIKSFVSDEPFTKNDTGLSDAGVFMFRDKVLKIFDLNYERDRGDAESENEVIMMDWLSGKLPVPKLLANEVENGKRFLLMSRVGGEMACSEKFMENPELLCTFLSKALKTLWSVDVSDCPEKSNWQLERKLLIAKKNVRDGKVDIDNVQPETFGEDGFENPETLLKWLCENQPKEELALSHGDFCLPNLFFENGRLSGFIDLGKTGIADKWCDIAICYRSLCNNFAGVYNGRMYDGFSSEMFFKKLGIEPNWEKIRYYILLDELF